MGALWPFLIQLVYLVGAGSALALAGWLVARRGERGPAAKAEAAALVLTACWSLAYIGVGPAASATSALLGLTQLAWLWCLYRLFAHDERDKSESQPSESIESGRLAGWTFRTTTTNGAQS